MIRITQLPRWLKGHMHQLQRSLPDPVRRPAFPSLLILTFLSLLGCASAADEALDLETVVGRHTQAMGGRAKLETLESVWRQRGERLFTLRAKPDFLLVLLLGEEGAVRYAEGFDGQVAWEQPGGGPRRAVAGRAREALWHTTQFPSNLNPLYRLASLGHRLELVGRDTLDGSIYHRVRLRLSDGFERDYFFNAATYRIERSRDVRRHHAYQEQKQPIEAVWGDFRQVEGFWFPFVELERNFETGERLSGGVPLLDLRVNVDVPKSVFRVDGDVEVLRWLIDEAAP